MAVLFLGLIMVIALIKDSISAISRKIKIRKIDTISSDNEIDNINTIKIESKLIETEKNEFIEKINKIYTKYTRNNYKRIAFIVLFLVSVIYITNSIWAIIPNIGFLVLICFTIKKVYISFTYCISPNPTNLVLDQLI